MRLFSGHSKKSANETEWAVAKFGDIINIINTTVENKIKRDMPNSGMALSAFVILSASSTTKRILEVQKMRMSFISKVFCEVKLFYDCMWQLQLLNRYQGPVGR